MRLSFDCFFGALVMCGWRGIRSSFLTREKREKRVTETFLLFSPCHGVSDLRPRLDEKENVHQFIG